MKVVRDQPHLFTTDHSVHPAEHDVGTRILERRQLLFKLIVMPDVIAVLESDIVAPGMCDAVIPCSTGARIFLAYINNPAIAKAPYNLGSIVRRPVIDNDEFNILVSLAKDAFDGPRQDMRPVIGRKNNRNHSTSTL